MRHQAQRHQHHHGVVRIRVVDVVELEGPAARLGVRVLVPPIAAQRRDFLAHQPLRGAPQRRVLRAQPALAERDHIDRRIPDRREARLDAEILRIIHQQPFEIALRLHVERMVRGIAKRLQRDERVQHRREDGAQAVAPLAHALDHPGFGAAPARRCRKGFQGSRPSTFSSLSQRRKKFRQLQKRRSLCSPEELLLAARRVELVQLLLRRQRARSACDDSGSPAA